MSRNNSRADALQSEPSIYFGSEQTHACKHSIDDASRSKPSSGCVVCTSKVKKGSVSRNRLGKCLESGIFKNWWNLEARGAYDERRGSSVTPSPNVTPVWAQCGEVWDYNSLTKNGNATTMFVGGCSKWKKKQVSWNSPSLLKLVCLNWESMVSTRFLGEASPTWSSWGVMCIWT